MRAFDYAQPTTVEEAAAMIVEGKGAAQLKAGGVDLLDQMKEGTLRPARLVNLLALPSLRGIREDRGAIVIGATTTLAEIAAHAGLRARAAAVAEAAGSAATPQVRNLATIGGNLFQRPRCAYFRSSEFHCIKKGGTQCFAEAGDNRYHAVLGAGASHIVHASTLATALVALDARARIRSTTGLGTLETPVEELYDLTSAAGPGRETRLREEQVLVEIVVPEAPGSGSAYAVAKERQVYDWPLGEVAVVLHVRGGVVKRSSVVLGAAAPIPWRAHAAEKRLEGQHVTLELARAAGAAALEGARPLAHNGYKLPLLAALVERAILAAAARVA